MRCSEVLRSFDARDALRLRFDARHSDDALMLIVMILMILTMHFVLSFLIYILRHSDDGGADDGDDTDDCDNGGDVELIALLYFFHISHFGFVMNSRNYGYSAKRIVQNAHSSRK